MTTALVWFRRDLRLTDNPAISAAAERHTHVLPVYVDAPAEDGAWPAGAASQWWLHHALAALADALAGAGAPLVIRRGEPLAELRALIAATGACAVYWNRLYEPAAIARDSAIKAALRDDGVSVESFNGALLAEPWTLQTGSGGAYKVFSPFWRNVDRQLRQQLTHGRTPLPTITHLQAPEDAPASVPLAALALRPRIAWDGGLADTWTPGESGAHAAVERFCNEAAADYREQRDLPARRGTSRLSPHLHFGEVSPLQIVARLERLLAEHPDAGLRANAEWYVRELGWREFAHHLLYHYPQTPAQALYEKFDAFPWRQSGDYAADLHTWQRGRTGIPIVDAGMRELWHTGWMHNRVRMIVASFLTKNLLIPWQEGARWFWDTLVDADLANNTLGWQWSAGCGADAAPYFRVFNPVTQSERFDPDGVYLKRWVPELATASGKALHAPWEAGRLPGGYPAPIVDLKASRQRALDAYEQIKADRQSER